MIKTPEAVRNCIIEVTENIKGFCDEMFLLKLTLCLDIMKRRRIIRGMEESNESGIYETEEFRRIKNANQRGNLMLL